MPSPLVEKIRATYPGAYAEMSDAQLEAAVLAKYPQYRDLAAPPVNQAGAAMREEWLGGARDIGNLAVGAVKGLGHTAVNLGRVPHMIPGFTEGVDLLYGDPGGSQRAFSVADQALAPRGTAQRVGRGVEQAAEFLAPAGLVNRGVKIAARVGPTVKAAARVAGEALGAGTVTAAQGGDPVTGAALGGAAPVVARVGRPGLVP